MCVDFVDQINGVIPFRLTPVKLASLVYRGNIQGATSGCFDRVKVRGEDGGSSDTRVWQNSTRRPLSPLFSWDGRDGDGGIHQTSNRKVCQGSRELRLSDGALYTAHSLLGWDGRDGDGRIHQTSNRRVCQGSREHRRKSGDPSRLCWEGKRKLTESSREFPKDSAQQSPKGSLWEARERRA